MQLKAKNPVKNLFRQAEATATAPSSTGNIIRKLNIIMGVVRKSPAFLPQGFKCFRVHDPDEWSRIR